jgi:hypothetical protein
MPLPRRAESSLLRDRCAFVLNSNNQTPFHFPNLFWFRLR